jgi:hypothetical protein
MLVDIRQTPVFVGHFAQLVSSVSPPEQELGLPVWPGLSLGRCGSEDAGREGNLSCCTVRLLEMLLADHFVSLRSKFTLLGLASRVTRHV